MMLKTHQNGALGRDSLSRCTLRKILRIDLGEYPYHIQTMQKLTAYDKRCRLAKAGALMEKIDVKRLSSHT